MRCYEVFSHSVPFPKEGFQKYDVVTPTDRKEYGTKYVVTDYIEVTHDPTKPCPYYQYEIREYSFVGYKHYKNPSDLNNKYQFVYSEKNFHIINDLNHLEEEVDLLIKKINSLDREYKLNTKHIINSLEQIKLQIKHLEQDELFEDITKEQMV